MANTEEWDNLSDDDFMDALDNATYEGTTEDNIEDTDHADETDSQEPADTETNEKIDDETQESEEEGFEEYEDDDEENTQAENDDEQGETVADATEDEATGSDETGNNTEADEADGEKAENINYQEEYAKLLEDSAKYQDFYNQVTGEFVANGRKVKGFDDPKKIIESQQMAAGFSEKMANFKQYRPFMNTLKEKGMLDDPSKFNLAMSLLEGDKEAIKKQMKDLEIDPFEMDMDKIDYVQKNQVSSNIELALGDVMDSASKHGVNEQVHKIISNDWDDQSVIELLEDPQNSADLIDHLNTGVYQVIQDRIGEKRRSDVNGVYGSKPAIEQYREATAELEVEYARHIQQQQAIQANQNEQLEAETPGSNEWIGNMQDPNEVEKNEAYKAKVEKQNAKTNEARRKASSLSKKKRGTRKPKKQVDPLQMDDDGFTEFLDSMIYQ